MTQIAKVAVAAATYAIDKPYDYLVPSGMELSVGCRVTVPFGRGNRTAEGMVLQLRQEIAHYLHDFRGISCGRRCLPSP